jgi:histone acetyltransferase (RNA polymerase elongator complex component)
VKKIIPIFVPHQGCTHRCIFCHQPNITGIALQTQVTPDDVRREIELALAEPRSKQKGAQFEVAFYGGTFTGLGLKVQEVFLQTVQPYIDRGDIVGIRLSTHPRMFDEEIFALLEAFSVGTVELGIQSFDNFVLKKAKRGYTAEEAEQTIRRLQHVGIDVGIHLMIGLPGDSFTKNMYSARRTAELQPTSVRIHPTLVIRGTQLEVLYKRGGYIPLSLETAVMMCKDMLKLFRDHQIPVIRIGLQPTESMEQNIVAGPYHPAIRQLVESAILYDEMESLCTTQPFSDNLAIFYVSPKDVSTARGQKNENIKKLQQRFHFTDVRILADNTIQRGQIRL